MSVQSRPRELRETTEKQRPCIVCGALTGDRTTTLSPEGRPRYKTYRCFDFDPCAARRNAGRKRPRA